MKGYPGFKVVYCPLPAAVHPDALVIPVAGDTSVLDETAKRIHIWALGYHERTGEPVRIHDIVKQFGVQHKLMNTLYLPHFPIEHMIDASLMYVDEGYSDE